MPLDAPRQTRQNLPAGALTIEGGLRKTLGHCPLSPCPRAWLALPGESCLPAGSPGRDGDRTRDPLMRTSCRGLEGTWGARERSQPGPQRGAGLPRAFVASPGDCTSFCAWTVLGTGPDVFVASRGPQDLNSVLLGGDGYSTGCPGVIQRTVAAPLIGTGHKASLCGSRQGQAWQSSRVTSLSPHPNLGPGTLSVCKMGSVILASTGLCL